MTAVIILLAVAIAVVVLVAEVVRLRGRVANLEKGREVVDRHLGHLTWRLDGEHGPKPPDQHLVRVVRERD